VTLEPAPPLQARVESRRTPPEVLPVPQQPDRGDVLRSLQTPESQGGQMANAAWDVRGMMNGRRMPMDMMALASRMGDLRPEQMLQQFQQLTRGLAEPANRLRAAAQGLSALALADDGRRALLITQDGVVRVVHVGALDDEPVLGLDLPGQIEVGTHPSLVTATVGSPDGRLVVTGGVDGDLRLWDASSCAPLAEIEVDAGVSALAISTDGKLLIAGCQDGAAHLLELPTLVLRRTLRGHREAVTALAAAGSRRLVVTGGEDGIVRTWDPVGGGARLTSRGHEGTIGALAVSANGQLVVSGGWDGKVLCWYARTGEVAQQWQAHDDVIAGLAIDRSGTFCATASDDRSVSVWRLTTGDRMAQRRDFNAGAKCVAFLEGENAVIAGSWDGSVRKIVW
jgi:WD40 repeat protein